MLAFGLLASLAAHAALYGRSHAMGGGYHAVLLQAAGLASLGVLFIFLTLTWSGLRASMAGSILAVRLRERLPSLWGVALCASLWYALAERIEPHHASAPAAALLVALAVASWLVLCVARGLLRLLAHAALAVSRLAFSPRAPTWQRRTWVHSVRRRTALVRRLFARPPPSATFSRA
jgi:hypothetical protein